MQVKGDILGLEKPVSSWLEHFKAIQPFPVSELVPVKRSKDVMGELGRQPAKKVSFLALDTLVSI